MASVVGRDLSGLSVLTRGLQAIAAAGHEAIGASQGRAMSMCSSLSTATRLIR
nr:hypothetical protein [Marinicella sp. W31]MDC2879625.1 hypothetical protein [Marinicella sp. W31]